MKSDSSIISSVEKPRKKAAFVGGYRIPSLILAFCLSLIWADAPCVQAQTAVAPTAGDGMTTETAFRVTEFWNRVGGTGTANSDTPLYPLVTNPGTGSITRKPNQAAYSPGTKVQVTAKPNKGYHFVEWTGDVPPGSETQNPLTVTMDSTRTLTARFELNQYRLVVRAEHGSVQQLPSLPNYSHGTQVTLVPHPETGYYFGWWSNSKTIQFPWWSDGTVDPTTSPITFTVTADTTVTAYFLRIYEIRTLSELQAIATGDLNGYYILMNDIDASDTANWNDEGTTEGLREGFRPIGKYQDFRNSFQGIFDGNGKKITGLTINRPKENGVGLFGSMVMGGTVRDLTLEGGSVTGNDHVGGMIGYQDWILELFNCVTSMTVTGKESVGGLVGKMYGYKVTNCAAHGSVTGGDGYAGGLIGESNCDFVRNCSATGSVTGEYVGGLIGVSSYPSGQITDCTVSGKITGTNPKGFVGGLIGNSGGFVITNCSYTGEVTGLGGSVGGLIGYCWEMTTIQGSNVSGAITATGTRRSSWWSEEVGIGGLVGVCSGLSNIENSSSLAQVTGASTDSSGARVGGLVGRIDMNYLFLLRCRSKGNIKSDSVAGGLVGRFGGDSCSILDSSATGSVTGFDCVGGVIGNGYYCDITNCTVTGAITGHSNVGGLAGFHVGLIANSSSSGPVNGDEYVGGLIGRGDYSYAWSPYPNSNIQNCFASGSVKGTGSFVGGLIGECIVDQGGFKMSECFASGSVTGSQYVGGLIGNSLRGDYVNCSARNTVNGNVFVGGLIGNMDSSADNYGIYGSIDSSSATGPVTGSKNVGGLVGSNKGVISNSFATNTVTVTSDTCVGGLVGYNGGPSATLQDCYTSGTVTGFNTVGGLVGYNDNGAGGILRSFALGRVEGSGEGIGGLVGRNQGADTKIENCFSIARVKGHESVGGIVGINENAPAGLLNCFTNGPVTGTGSSVGGLIGNNTGTGARVENSFVTAPVSGEARVGGLVGRNDAGAWILNCFAAGSVEGTSQSIGGLLGSSRATNMEISYASGPVIGLGPNVGGLIGENLDDSTVTNCYATGAVTGRERTGGLVGNNRSSWISRCYAVGRVTGTPPSVGGLIGESADSTVTACYWDVETSSQTVSAGGTGAVGKTSIEMKQQATFQTEEGAGANDWDFAFIWRITEEETYPYFLEYSAGSQYPQPVHLSLRVEGPGTVHPMLPDGLYAYGTAVTLRAKPAPGYRLVRWAEPLPTGTLPPNPLALEITQDTSLTARFELAHPAMWMVR